MTPEALVTSLYRAEQLDLLHLSLISLLDMVRDQEINLVLEQSSKSDQHKKLFLEKLIAGVKSKELAAALTTELKAGNLSFFEEKPFGDFLKAMQDIAHTCVIIRLTVAIAFKEKDIKEMATLMSEKIGAQVVLSCKVDGSLIGGVIIQHGSYVSDYSLKSQLDLFRSHWHKAVAHSA